MPPQTPADRRWSRASLFLFLVVAAVMLATLRDYGMTGDEGVQHRYARRLLRFYTSFGADRAVLADEDITMYGGFFEVAAETAASLAPSDPYLARHLVNLLFALGGIAAAGVMGRHLAGPRAGFLAMAFLVLTPPFYGHAFNNPKDIPFAATYAAAACAVLLASERLAAGRAAGPTIAAGVTIGLAAGVRVAGAVLLGYALALWVAIAWPRGRNAVRRAVVAWLLTVGIAWVVMLAFWPWAQQAPFTNPARAWRAFSRFWDTQVVFFDGAYVNARDVSRLYLPTWFSLTLPETYAVALVLGALALVRAARTRPPDPALRPRLVQLGWLSALAVLPVGWVVFRHTPLYDGLRHFLFVVPVLAVLAGVAVSSFFSRSTVWSRGLGAGALAVAAAVTLVDMVRLHPYQAVYFNRVVAGGLRQALTRYEGDYWCLSYKEGVEWLVRRFEGTRCRERVRVAGHSILLQTSYYLRKADPEEQRFNTVGAGGSPHYMLVTTRFGDHLRTEGRLVHTVDRLGASLLYVFEQRPPACEPPVVLSGRR
ncbi:MAG TPA: hypothetical protein VFM29_02620 [Vicinamibacteria bacterium]|nr:hypothetical protein [Vicinamibacteria bacterium]